MRPTKNPSVVDDEMEMSANDTLVPFVESEVEGTNLQRTSLDLVVPGDTSQCRGFLVIPANVDPSRVQFLASIQSNKCNFACECIPAN